MKLSTLWTISGLVTLVIMLGVAFCTPARSEPCDVRCGIDAGTAWATLRHFKAPATPRPGKWCGWYARGLVDQDPGQRFDRAIEWAKWGRPVARCTPGAMAVWRNHIGLALACPEPGRVELLSGNVKGRVSRDVRRTHRVVAWRLPPARYASR